MNKILNLKLTFVVFLIIFLLSSCSKSVRFTSVGSSSSGDEIGLASYYDDKYEGRKTASGEVFYQDKLSAAHRTIKFGTKVKVVNLENNKEVVVVINDRGPFVAGRIIDLSKSAAKKIGLDKQGIVKVKIEIVD